MSWIKGIPDNPPLDFTYVTDKQMVTMNLNIQLTSVEEVEQFEAEVKKRGLVEKRDYYQRNLADIRSDKVARAEFLKTI